MLKDIFFLSCFLFCVVSCMSTAAEEKIYHAADLQDDLWREDTTAVEQVFTIRQDTITTLTAEKGTKLIIPANAFRLKTDPDAVVHGPVELRITEVYELAGMFREHLTTQDSDMKPLESGGMLHLAAYAGEKELSLKEGKKILLGFPQKEGFEKASLFSGKVNERTAIEWSLADSVSMQVLTVEKIIDLGEFGDSTIRSAVKVQDNDISASRNMDASTAEELINRAIESAQEGSETGYFYFYTEKLNWINFDRYLDEELAEVLVDISDFPANTLYYLVPEDLNALIYGYRKEEEADESHPVFERVPLGHKATIMAIYNKAGDYYLATQVVEVGGSEPIRLKPEKTEKEKIVRYMKSLGDQPLSASR